VRVKGWRFNGGMPALTRRRSKDAREECWHVYYGDVRVGTIAIRSGNPADTDPWAWSCGFYPGSHPREYTSGTAATFEGWSRDISTDVAEELRRRCEREARAIPPSLEGFFARHESDRQLTLRLV
jgi:hypothetical protein